MKRHYAAKFAVFLMITVHLFLPSTTTIAQLLQRIELAKGAQFLAISEGSVWVWNETDRAIDQIDLATGRTVKKMAVDLKPLTGSVQDGFLWLCNETRDSLVRLDLTTYELVAVIDIGVYFEEWEFVTVVTGDGTVWIKGEEEVLQIDPKTNQILGEPIIAGEEILVAVIADGELWTGSHDDGLISRIDPQTNQIVAQFEVGFSVHGLAVDSNSVWVLDEHGFAVVHVSPETYAITSRIPINFVASNLAVADGDVWVAPAARESGRLLGNDVFVRIDGETHAIVEETHVGEIETDGDDGYYLGLSTPAGVWALVVGNPTALVQLSSK